MKLRTQLLLASTLALTLLAGCGMQATTSSSPAEDLGLVAGYQVGGSAAGPHGMMNPGGPMARHLTQALALTQAQQDQLRAIHEQYHPASASLAPAAQLQQVKALLAAPTVDAAALTALMQGHHAEMAGHGARLLAGLTAARAVLTPEQLTKITQLVEQGPRMRGMHGAAPGGHLEQLFGTLKLTAAQQQAADALKAQFEGMKPQHEAMRAAALAFAKTGDSSALGALLSAPPRMPVEAVVGFLASLDQGQRQTLIRRFEAPRPHMGMHH